MKKRSLLALCIVLIMAVSLCSCTKDDQPKKPTKAAAVEIVDRYINDLNDKGSYSAETTVSISSGTSTTTVKSADKLQYKKSGDDLVFYNHTSTTKKDSVEATANITYHEGVFYYSDGKDLKIKSTADKKAIKECFSFGPGLPSQSTDFNTIKFGPKDDGYILSMSDLKVDSLVNTDKYLEKSLGYLNGAVDKVTDTTIVAKFDNEFKLVSARLAVECESQSGIVATLAIEMSDFSDECKPVKPENDHEYAQVEAAHYYYMINNALSSLPYANNYKAESKMTTIIKGCPSPFENGYTMTVEKNAGTLTAEQSFFAGYSKGASYSLNDGRLTVKNGQDTSSKKFSEEEAKAFVMLCVTPASGIEISDIEQISVTKNADGNRVIKLTPSSKTGCDLMNEVAKATYSEHSTINTLTDNYLEITVSDEEIVGVKYRFATADGCLMEYALKYTAIEPTGSTV